MHELSLVRSLLSQVQAVVREHGAERAEEIRVEIGPLAGVEPLLVQSAFEQLVGQSAGASELAGARLAIDEAPLEANCAACGTAFEIEQIRFECPVCESRQVRITRGDEFRLVSVTVQEEST